MGWVPGQRGVPAAPEASRKLEKLYKPERVPLGSEVLHGSANFYCTPS